MIVIKLGGAALKKSLEDEKLFQALATVHETMVLVHGGGPEINQMSQALGLKSEFFEGQRVSSPEVVSVVETVLRGKIAPALVRGLLKAGRKAVAISGVDAATFECSPEDDRLGRVGHVQTMNAELIQLLLAQKYIVVLSPVGLFPDGEACNVNADLAASKVAERLQARSLLFLTDKDGILNAQGQVIRSMGRSELEALCKSGEISGGMKVKARAMLELKEALPGCRIEVMNGLDAAALKATLSGGNSGTKLSD